MEPLFRLTQESILTLVHTARPMTTQEKKTAISLEKEIAAEKAAVQKMLKSGGVPIKTA